MPFVGAAFVISLVVADKGGVLLLLLRFMISVCLVPGADDDLRLKFVQFGVAALVPSCSWLPCATGAILPLAFPELFLYLPHYWSAVRSLTAYERLPYLFGHGGFHTLGLAGWCH